MTGNTLIDGTILMVLAVASLPLIFGLFIFCQAVFKFMKFDAKRVLRDELFMTAVAVMLWPLIVIYLGLNFLAEIVRAFCAWCMEMGEAADRRREARRERRSKT